VSDASFIPLRPILALLPALKKRPFSDIIVVTSGCPRAYPRMPIYSAAKAGLGGIEK
jgi:short-subunit dehydrogenase involved in D-alanine esterification of teichoic acids